MILEELSSLLTHSSSLINHIYWFKQDFNITPQKDHIGTAINFTDISERKEDFLGELINTISSWVYSKKKTKKIIDERLSIVENDIANAATFLTTQAFSKFRPGKPQGQFGELLLFNFLQFFYKSVPLLRKQRITTSVGHERFGVDAIHYRKELQKNVIVLGESKCYESKYRFKVAFKESLDSIISTFNALNKELNLYTYDDFIEPEVEHIAKKYKMGTLGNVQFELVCLIVYNETNKIDGIDEQAIKESIREVIQDRCNSLESDFFDSQEERILNRINYVIFPIWGLDKLLDDFQKKVGS